MANVGTLWKEDAGRRITQMRTDRFDSSAAKKIRPLGVESTAEPR